MASHVLEPRFLEKVWGSHHLSPWYPDSPVKIGEVWLEDPRENLPLLLKFLFTTERLSVQVHPNDAYALQHHQSKGKTEMWHILRAGHGAQIALGLKHRLSRGELREASKSGQILQLLNWIDVQPGETYFVPAGTIHAIGAGVALCEIQQFSNVTYRLYDYGRPRELHLDHGVAVSDLEAYVPAAQPAGGLLVECEYFRTELIECNPSQLVSGSGLLIAIEGEGTSNGVPFRQGEAWKIEPGGERIEGSARLLRTGVPLSNSVERLREIV